MKNRLLRFAALVGVSVGVSVLEVQARPVAKSGENARYQGGGAGPNMVSVRDDMGEIVGYRSRSMDVLDENSGRPIGYVVSDVAGYAVGTLENGVFRRFAQR